LHEPIIGEDSIRHVNFFNGRLLTGTDLRREQIARHSADGRLGLCIGSGVNHGLLVELSSGPNGPIAQVKAGLALNKNGQTLWLGSDIDVALAKRAVPPGEATPCLFEKCTKAEAGGFVNAGQGLFLLTIAPSYRHEGRAPMNALGDVLARCNTDAEVEAVQFRLIEVPLTPTQLSQINAPNFQNLVAYSCFGDHIQPDWARNSFINPNRAAENNLLTNLTGLHDFDVPLALLAFGPEFAPLFADNWSVRRMIAPENVSGAFSILTAPARAPLGQAMLSQFQAQLEKTTVARATDVFDYLPPVGVLEGYSDEDAQAFFAGLTTRGPVHIDEAQVEPLIRESLNAPAINTDSDHTIWLYRVAHSGMSATPGSTLLFANGHLPYRADARFNLNYWDHANYALIGDDCCGYGYDEDGGIITPVPEPTPPPNKSKIKIGKVEYYAGGGSQILDYPYVSIWGKNLTPEVVIKARLGSLNIDQIFWNFRDSDWGPDDPDMVIILSESDLKKYGRKMSLFDKFGEANFEVPPATKRLFITREGTKSWLKPPR
jgi:hypothetical protein